MNELKKLAVELRATDTYGPDMNFDYADHLDAYIKKQESVERVAWRVHFADGRQSRLFTNEGEVKDCASAAPCAVTIQELYAAPPPHEELESLKRDAARYRELNTPEIADFLAAVEREALHQRDRWAAEHDAGKTDADWFWLIGYLAGKAINKPEKILHHIITTAAACLNWHAAKIGIHNTMRPGIAQEKANVRQEHSYE